MKDTDKVELTVEAVKRAAEKCGTAKEILKELFPEVFRESPPKEEWEDITGGCRFVPDNAGGPFIMCGDLKVSWVPAYEYRVYSSSYKVDDGKIWRKKSA
jgi:hypothetical protein